MDSDPSPTDRQAEEAIRRARAGDTEAFGVVVARYELPIQAWVASAGYPGVDVDEVTQRAFIAAFTNLHRYPGGHGPPAPAPRRRSIAPRQGRKDRARPRRRPVDPRRRGHMPKGDAGRRGRDRYRTGPGRARELRCCAGRQ
jgi:hypothetical protein